MKKKQKILLVSHEMTYTGAPRSLLNIAKILKKSGTEVDVWTLKKGDFQREFEKEQIPVSILSKTIGEDRLRQYQLIILNTFFTAHLAERFQKITRTVLYIREGRNIPVLVRDCRKIPGISGKPERTPEVWLNRPLDAFVLL